MGMFLLPAVWKFVACDVAVIEIHPGDKAVDHLYPACPVGDRSMLFSVAHNGHMMWGKPTTSTSETEWRDWLVSAKQGAITNHPAIGWKKRTGSQSQEEENGDIKPTLRPRGQCGLMIKVGLTAVTVGAYGVSPGV